MIIINKSALTIIILILLFRLIAKSEEYLEFTAEEGIPTIVHAAAMGGILDPDVITIATINGILPKISNPLAFKVSNGTNIAWAYYVRSIHYPEISYSYVLTKKPVTGFITVGTDAKLIFDKLPYSPDKSMINIDFFDSDQLEYYLLCNEFYKSYILANPDAEAESVCLGGSSISYPEGTDGMIVWYVIMNSKEGKMRCRINAETGETICDDYNTNVNDTISFCKFELYPNPTSDYIEISSFNKGLQPLVKDGVIEIYNTLGECVLIESVHSITCSHRINVEHLAAGLYLIRNGYYSEKFIVIR